jgi:ABC-type phosphate/phosphonate transport system ATPase subunit
MLRGRLQVEDDWLHRWETLSHGERRRTQVSVALWQSPALMAIDDGKFPIGAVF